MNDKKQDGKEAIMKTTAHLENTPDGESFIKGTNIIISE